MRPDEITDYFRLMTAACPEWATVIVAAEARLGEVERERDGYFRAWTAVEQMRQDSERREEWNAQARDAALAEVARLRASMTWQPIATAPKDGTTVLLLVPTNNGIDPKYARVCGFFAAAGTQDMDSCTDDDLMDKGGCNTRDAWFEGSAFRDPFAWMLLYSPTYWMPLPAAPAEGARHD
ncbi:MAG TPA: hypothetical protein VM487_05035 [Phycisphaerae bacterium]|nr:hypothetical protein [Phycisphaerae bacterium]